MQGTRELVEDQRPVYTLWRAVGECAAGELRTVWVFQAEGGRISEEAVEAFFEALRSYVAPTVGSYVTFYDFSEPVSNVAPFALQLARTLAAIRSQMRCVCTVVVCVDPVTRGVLRYIAELVGGDRPYVIVDSAAKGWEAALAAEEAVE